MDEAERRFRACTDRFRRDLTRIISRSIDGMVRDALKEAAKKEASDAVAAKQHAREAARAARIDARAARVAQKAAAKQARVDEREAKRAAAKAEKIKRAGERLQLKRELAALRPVKAGGRKRMRADSLLGSELADASQGALGAAGVAQPPKQPSERPLFVHKRARDGQIHALRRGVREGAQSAREGAQSVREGAQSVVRESTPPVQSAPAAEPKVDAESQP